MIYYQSNILNKNLFLNNKLEKIIIKIKYQKIIWLRKKLNCTITDLT